MLTVLTTKYNNWLTSDHKLRKLGVSLHYWLFRHKLWTEVLSLSTKEKFTAIYRNNLWNNEESLSGGGSTLKRTLQIRHSLLDFIRDNSISSICDAGCGDFHWMQTLENRNFKYIGVDIVKDIIALNKDRYGDSNTYFVELDVIHDDLPTTDLILCRHCLFHFSFEDIFTTIINFKNSRSTFLLATHHPNLLDNTDIVTGQCRGINFQKAPFHFPEPIRLIDEAIPDQCLALWHLKDINPLLFGT